MSIRNDSGECCIRALSGKGEIPCGYAAALSRPNTQPNTYASLFVITILLSKPQKLRKIFLILLTLGLVLVALMPFGGLAAHDII